MGGKEKRKPSEKKQMVDSLAFPHKTLCALISVASCGALPPGLSLAAPVLSIISLLKQVTVSEHYPALCCE